LEEFKLKVEELLKEFLDHPLLLQLITIANRILSFSISSPIMKILIGLELLLKQAQEWEFRASKRVSLKDNLDIIFSLVTRFRKFELDSWELILQSKSDSFKIQASKWWFYLYRIIHNNTQVEDPNQLQTIFQR
jgi:midasin